MAPLFIGKSTKIPVPTLKMGKIDASAVTKSDRYRTKAFAARERPCCWQLV
ncbi:hypothetical protein HanLR1_Chr03g0082341 [Helianthus annuus]|nr:hypothetical protein HanHA89_Chr03g0089181 [Helianthus annuus]KAJ0766852.1 hypothetical protein HanLR1_Chr03g0082341 [Helianthus annuus]